MPRQLLAFDLGAESGRAILGHLDDGSLELRELHRFATGATQVLGRLYWDVLRFFDEIQTGLRAAADYDDLGSVGIDTWGVDYGLLADDGTSVSNLFSGDAGRSSMVMSRIEPGRGALATRRALAAFVARPDGLARLT